MPVAPPAVSGAIMAAAPTLFGPAWFQLCAAIGVGVVSWSVVPANVIVTGTTTGTIGAGAVTGKIVIPPVPAPVVASVAGAGLIGLSGAQIATAVGIGVGTSYSATGA